MRTDIIAWLTFVVALCASSTLKAAAPQAPPSVIHNISAIPSSDANSLGDNVESTSDVPHSLPHLFGAHAGFDFCSHKASFEVLDSGRVAGRTIDGEGSGMHASLVAFLPLTSWLYFSPRLGVEGRGGILLTEAESLPTLDDKNQLVTMAIRHEMDITMPCLNADLMLAPAISTKPLLYPCAGVSIAIPLQKHFSAYQRIVSPTSVNFPSGLQTRDASEGNVPNMRAVLLGLRFGVGALIKLRALTMQTECVVHMPLQAMTTDANVNWRSTQVFLSVGLLKAW